MRNDIIAPSQIRTGVMRFRVSGDNHYTNGAQGKKEKCKSRVGLEPTTFRLEVERAIHCATRTCEPFNASARGDRFGLDRFFFGSRLPG